MYSREADIIRSRVEDPYAIICNHRYTADTADSIYQSYKVDGKEALEHTDIQRLHSYNDSGYTQSEQNINTSRLSVSIFNLIPDACSSIIKKKDSSIDKLNASLRQYDSALVWYSSEYQKLIEIISTDDKDRSILELKVSLQNKDREIEAGKQEIEQLNHAILEVMNQNSEDNTKIAELYDKLLAVERMEEELYTRKQATISEMVRSRITAIVNEIKHTVKIVGNVLLIGVAWPVLVTRYTDSRGYIKGVLNYIVEEYTEEDIENYAERINIVEEDLQSSADLSTIETSMADYEHTIQ